MLILITGIGGFIGFHTAKRLLKEGYDIIGVDNFNDYYSVQLKYDRLKELNLHFADNINSSSSFGITVIRGDISRREVWSTLGKYKPDKVVHLAAQAGVRYSLENPFAYIESNILGFQYAIDFCVDQRIKSFVYASSSSVYGMNSSQPFTELESCNFPESLYAATKRSNELVAYSYFKTKGLKSIGLRFFTVYGPWGRPDMAPMLFALSALKNRKIDIFNNGKQKRDFTFIDDIVEGILQCACIEEGRIGGAEIFNLGRGEPISLMNFVELIEKHFNIRLKKNFREAQKGDVSVTYADVSKLRKLTGYSPKTNLDEGLKIFTDWYIAYFEKQLID